MSSVFFPILSFVLQLVVIAWFVLVFTYLASSSEKQFEFMDNGDQPCPNGTVGTTCAIGQLHDGCICSFVRLGNESHIWTLSLDIYNFLQAIMSRPTTCSCTTCSCCSGACVS